MIDKFKLKEFEKKFLTELNKCDTLFKIDNLFRENFSKKGKFSLLMKKIIYETSTSEKKNYMPIVNELKTKLVFLLNKKKEELDLQRLKNELQKRKVFIEEFAENPHNGYIHPNFLLIDKIKKILLNKGFLEVNDSPVETSEYNFFRLNVTRKHPAFATDDTFFIDNKQERLLRAHCTSSTARILEKNKNKEFAAFTVGNVFRRDTDDATHTHQFIQLDLVKVLRNSSVWELKSFLKGFIQELMNKELEVRFRPSYFPFTTPSFELEVKCWVKSNNCTICKNTGWIELLGAGMLHEDVFKNAGYSINILRKNNLVGWAFGMGVDRLASIIYEIPDARMLYENKLSFLKHFTRRD